MKKKVSKKPKRRIFFLCMIALSLFGCLMYNVSIYFKKINDTHKEINKLSAKLEDLTEAEEILKSEIVKLEDPEYVAKFAREKYLYSKDGEKIFRIIK